MRIYRFSEYRSGKIIYCVVFLAEKIWNVRTGERQKIGCAFQAPALGAAVFRLFGQKVLWLWENPWAIIAENPPIVVTSGTYEKVRTCFEQNF